MPKPSDFTQAFLAELFDPLQGLLDDPSVTDIFIGGDEKRVTCERNGQIEESGIDLGNIDLQRVANHIAREVGEELNETTPSLNAEYDHLRVAVVIPPISQRGVSVSLRKFMGDRFSLEELIRHGMLSGDLAETLTQALANRETILISGATGSGKTTLLIALLRTIPETDRVILIQDTAEITLQRKNLESMQARFEMRRGGKSLPAFTMRDCLRMALRMRPDRLILGEVRGAEAWDLIQALNTGHGGSLSTIHANNASDALARLTDLALEAGIPLPSQQVRSRILRSVRHIVQVQRLANCERKLTAVVTLPLCESSAG